MIKEYISDQRLEEKVVNFLRSKAESEEPSIEDFSFKAIMSKLQKKYDVNESRLKKILDKLEKEEIISVLRPKVFDVYVPRGYEKKFSGLTRKIEPTTLIIIAIVIGHYVLSAIFPYLGLKMTITLYNPNDFLILIWFGFIIPLLVGAVIIFIGKFVWDVLYRNIRIFREMVEFFGGARVWGYALFFAVIFLSLYIVLAVFTKSEINPYFATALLSGTFLGVLYYGKKKG